MRDADVSRRMVLQTVATGVALVVAPTLAAATPDQVADEFRKVFGTRTPKEGRIKFDLPPIVENGQSVPLGVEVESPMTPADHVKSVFILADGNPNPLVAAVRFTPVIPKASAQIRIRLAQTQNVIAYAEMANGDVYVAKREVRVTVGGCAG
jgi:sulfur-oxidizing protein SoxY